MRLAGHLVRMGKGRGVCSVLVSKPEQKRPSGVPGVNGNYNWPNLKVGNMNSTQGI